MYKNKYNNSDNEDDDYNNRDNNKNNDYHIDEDDDDDFYFDHHRHNSKNINNDNQSDNDNNDHEKKQEQEGEEPIIRLTNDDSTCSICLSPFENLTFLDVCFHQFCFVCILQWSELNQKCPLCKSEYHSLIYQVKSNTDYQRFIINTTNGKTSKSTITTNTHHSNNNDRQQQQQHKRRQQQVYLPSLSTTEQHNIRKRVYSRNVRAIPMVAPFKLYLDPLSVNANFKSFKTKVHPWITRELQSILQTSNTEILENLIFELLKKYNIVHDPLVHQTLVKFLFEKTDLFIHELLCFATSPYNMATYDQKVLYDKRQSLITQQSQEQQQNTSQMNDEIGIDESSVMEPLSNMLQQSSSPINHIPLFLSNILEEEIEKQNEIETSQVNKRKLGQQQDEKENVLKIMRLQEPNWNHFNESNKNCTTDSIEEEISNLSGYIHKLKQYKSNKN